LGYDALINDLGDLVEYELTRLKPSVSEGFPNFNREWDEATRYPEFVNLGKKKWIELVSKGKPVTVTRKNVNKINNTDAADPKSFKLLDPEKQKRALAQLANGNVEMPIVARYSDGYLELIGGNTRLTAQMAKDGQAKVWLFNVPEELTQGVSEATGDEKFDTMMSRMAAEPKVADMHSNMPPTSIPELLQWANKNNKPYHRKFAEWARNHNFTNVNAALEWFGDNVDPWDEFGSKEHENVFGDLVGEPLIDAAKHDPKAAELLKVYVSYEKIFDDWTDKYRQMNYPDRFGNFNEQGVAEGKHPGQPVVDAILKVMPIAQEIWFHGSRATGKHRRNSDTDILVVVPDDLVGNQYLGVVRILQKLSTHFDNYDIQPTKAETNIHRIAQEEGKLLWSKQGVAEGLNFDEIYGKYLKVTDNNGDPDKPGFSLVTPLNGDSWNWRERPEFKDLVKQKLNDPGFLGDHKYQQIIDAMSGKQFDPTKHIAKENFADGKVKGRSRPGRVKRAGASCNGSVTDLRQRAKNSSGEKAKMYHWCANMKSGKKK
jgi:predicted nucleotidyltransferase